MTFDDDEEARAWDLFAAQALVRNMVDIERGTDSVHIPRIVFLIADAMIEKRRERDRDYCEKCRKSMEWFEDYDGEVRCGGCESARGKP